MRGLVKKGDIIIVLLIALLSVGLLLNNFSYDGERYAEVYENGELIYTLDLNKNDKYEVALTGGRLLVSDGEVCYVQSDCPDGTCESFGWLSRVGDTASCVPNKTVVIIVGQTDDAPDAITY